MDKKFTILMVVFFIILGVLIGFVANDSHLASFARASTETDPSAQTSLIFAWPQVPIPKVGTQIDIDVFVRNVNNGPLNKKEVRVSTDLGTINGSPQATDITDPSGHVHFKLVSNAPGTAHITAFVTDSNTVSHQLNQTVSVKFE